ncbi:MAG: caspase family protein [Geminicoccaceae bacterium]
MRRSLVEFGRALSGADAGLFFYAGHGMEFNGSNYLVPVDADLQTEADVYVQTMILDDILRVMESAVPTRLVFLDACRNNPLARRLQRNMNPSRGAALGRGLAKVDAGVGTLIAYATAPGDVAEDGEGANSPFTTALLEHLPVRGVEVNEMLTRVRRDVVSVTGSQVPWASSSLVGPFFLGGDVEPEPEPEPVPAPLAIASEPVQPMPVFRSDPQISDRRKCSIGRPSRTAAIRRISRIISRPSPMASSRASPAARSDRCAGRRTPLLWGSLAEPDSSRNAPPEVPFR